MRIELAGAIQEVKPLTLTFIENQDFDVEAYMDMGFTNFDVICIGGGGGRGGGIDTANTGTLIRNYGGEGGGGGFHRVRGPLSDLPSICPVVVGAGGALGTEHNSNPALTTNGGDGGYSSFNVDTCRASGGKGGKRAVSNSSTSATVADGGEGGIGNRIVSGGGGGGGAAGIPQAAGPGSPLSTDAEDGPITENIGHGGGGGAGGVGLYGSAVTCLAGTYGGRGSYNPDDILVSGPGEDPQIDPSTGAADVVPGSASGANASPLNGLPYVYGRSNEPGVVVIRLWTE